MRAFRRAVAAAALLLVGTIPTASAHGLWGHIHVTGWAIENLPDGELRDFFSDPEVLNAALFGATYTDAGYSVSGSLQGLARDIAEQTHWEPFITAYVQWIRDNDPPPWTDLESKKRVAFLMGCASHGLQDEVFDTLFLYQVGEHDDGDQDSADPGTDGFLALQGYLRFVPKEYVPREAIRGLYVGIDDALYDAAVDKSLSLVLGAYINDAFGIAAARASGEYYEPIIPWSYDHYLDPAIPGSLRAEILPTLRYLQVIWKRLHDPSDAETVTATYPELPRRLPSVLTGTPDAWVSLMFGAGVLYNQLTPTWEQLSGPAGAALSPVPFELVNSRWGPAETRIVKLTPTSELTPGAWYRVQVPKLPRLDGVAGTPFGFEFQAECATDGDPACPAVTPAEWAIDGKPIVPDEGPDAAEVDDAPGSDDLGSNPSDADSSAADASASPDLGERSTDASGGCVAAPSAQRHAYFALTFLLIIVARARRIWATSRS